MYVGFRKILSKTKKKKEDIYIILNQKPFREIT